MFGLGHLERFKKEYGHTNVHARYKTKDGYALGGWVANRRNNKREGKLTQDKIDRIEDLGFIWDSAEESFIQGLNYLKKFKKEYGHTNVPARYKAKNGYALGGWVSSRRTDKKTGKLSQDKIDRLDQLGFVWDLSK